ncbi:MAG: 50S ribosomal protein L35 [Candidatus Roizmanbacteria bacterium GW2011_GWA2_36_23]|uniref:Large ribosomal subunit protein bL35 n=1 Tax=Candidatus Roizmanbacteria bacterium GW2011_GWA2_36_23 TaxID=1618480 RepID=A0A0G0EK06_9BACT|nr:MAG: 50S ribosomal protein L35 [Candidatus Roizmanbacteria bacterium GW2011_GWA2_36_23]
MSKQKTRKSAVKRFKITKNGKVMHRSQGIRHLQANKSKKRIRRMRQMKTVEGAFKNKLLRMMGLK